MLRVCVVLVLVFCACACGVLVLVCVVLVLVLVCCACVVLRREFIFDSASLGSPLVLLNGYAAVSVGRDRRFKLAPLFTWCITRREVQALLLHDGPALAARAGHQAKIPAAKDARIIRCYAAWAGSTDVVTHDADPSQSKDGCEEDVPRCVKPCKHRHRRLE